MRRKLLRYFSRAERLLWGLSAAFIVGSFCAFDRENYLTLAASLIGVMITMSLFFRMPNFISL